MQTWIRFLSYLTHVHVFACSRKYFATVRTLIMTCHENAFNKCTEIMSSQGHRRHVEVAILAKLWETVPKRTIVIQVQYNIYMY